LKRAHIGLAVLGALLVALPAFVGSYALSVATLILYFAYTGQAWNVMMGFAGLLSLGHSLFVGVTPFRAPERAELLYGLADRYKG
jgi:branched-chain amino acid transport system permease protein